MRGKFIKRAGSFALSERGTGLQTRRQPSHFNGDQGANSSLPREDKKISFLKSFLAERFLIS